MSNNGQTNVEIYNIRSLHVRNISTCMHEAWKQSKGEVYRAVQLFCVEYSKLISNEPKILKKNDVVTLFMSAGSLFRIWNTNDVYMNQRQPLTYRLLPGLGQAHTECAGLNYSLKAQTLNSDVTNMTEQH